MNQDLRATEVTYWLLLIHILSFQVLPPVITIARTHFIIFSFTAMELEVCKKTQTLLCSFSDSEYGN